MATEYIKIVLSNIQNNEPTWPLPPLTIYTLKSIWDIGYVEIAEMWDDTAFYSTRIAFFTPQQVHWIYKGVRGSSGTNYARLAVDNSDFAAAIQKGIYTGSYTGDYGETWSIQHRIHVDALSLPSGEGGDVGLDFTNPPPANEPPNKAQNPTPSDGATNINLIIPQISWEAG